MANVYSTQFIEAPSFSGGPTTLFTVPVGYRAVVRSISFVWGSLLLSGLDASVQTDSNVRLVRRVVSIGFQDYLNSGGCDVFTGWWVVNSGEQIQALVPSGTIDVFASGHLLTLP